MKKAAAKTTDILAVDIGNTTTALALFKADRIIARKAFATGAASSAKVLAALRYFKEVSPKLAICLVCSVVPGALARHKKILKRFFGKNIFIAGENFRIPIKNDYRRPSQVGQDRLAGAFSAKLRYGSPLIVIDFGTALTIDVVSAKGTYKGGMIIPGISLSLKALAEHTALLPQVAVQKPSALIGRNTQESILSGVFYGYVALITGVVKKIKSELKINPTVVLTGGYGHYMGKFLKPCVDHFEPDLVFHGLRLAFCSTRK